MENCYTTHSEKPLWKTMKKILNKINIFNFFYQGLRGELELWKSFWIIYILFGMFYLAFLEYIFHHYLTGYWITFKYHNHSMDQFITLAFPWLFLSAMCVWACAKNSWLEWKLSSRIIVIIPILVSSFHLTNIF